MMTDNERWRVIEDARRAAEGKFEREAENIVAHIVQWPPDEIVAFGQWVRERMKEATLTELYLVVTWVFDVNGFNVVTGDSWEYWRGWLVGRGRGDYRAALTNADVVAEFYTDFEDFLGGEEIEIAAHQAYRLATGGRDCPEAMYDPSLIENYPAYWSEEDVKVVRLVERYPRMVKRFGLPSFAIWESLS